MVRDLARSYATMLGIAPPQPDHLASLVLQISAPEFLPKNKIIFVDESLTEHDIQGIVICGCWLSAIQYYCLHESRGMW